MISFDEKLRDLLRIVNIPIRERWPEHSDPNSIYSYWSGIGLLDNRAEQEIKVAKGSVVQTQVIRRFFQNVDYYWHPETYAGRAAADLGSGFGHLTIWLLLSGAREVLSIGDAPRMSFVRKLHAAAVSEGILRAGSLIGRDQLLSADEASLLPDRGNGWLALVLMNDALEHINPRVRPAVFRVCFDALGPGGLLVSRQHNSDCPRVLARLRAIWTECEESLYLPVRREALALNLGNVAPEVIECMARATRGCDSQALTDAIGLFRRDGRVPPVATDGAPIDIRTDEVCEGWTGMNMILGELRQAGFQAYAYPAMREGRRSAFLQPVARAMPDLFFRFHVFDDNTVLVGRRIGE